MTVRNGTATHDDERPLEAVLDGYVDDGEPELGNSAKAKAGRERNRQELDAAVRRVGQRDLARRPGYDPTVRVRHVEPASGRRPIDNEECADCGVAFLIGEGRRRDPDRHDLLVHTNGGCDRARLRATARNRASAPQTQRSEEAPMEAATAPPPASEATPAPPADAPTDEQPRGRSNPILEFLEANGPAVGGEIAAATGRATGNVTTRLRQMEADGRVRRTGRSLPMGRGRPQIEWALADGSAPPDSIDAPTPPGVTAARVRQELAELIRAEDLEELLDTYCHGITLAEADADTLARVLRVRRTIELVAARVDGDPE